MDWRAVLTAKCNGSKKIQRCIKPYTAAGHGIPPPSFIRTPPKSLNTVRNGAVNLGQILKNAPSSCSQCFLCDVKPCATGFPAMKSNKNRSPKGTRDKRTAGCCETLTRNKDKAVWDISFDFTQQPVGRRPHPAVGGREEGAGSIASVHLDFLLLLYCWSDTQIEKCFETQKWCCSTGTSKEKKNKASINSVKTTDLTFPLERKILSANFFFRLGILRYWIEKDEAQPTFGNSAVLLQRPCNNVVARRALKANDFGVGFLFFVFLLTKISLCKSCELRSGSV